MITVLMVACSAVTNALTMMVAVTVEMVESSAVTTALIAMVIVTSVTVPNHW